MDPNEALKEIREEIAEFSQLSDDNFVDALISADKIVELIKGLDEWLSKGGFLPDDWRSEKHHIKGPEKNRIATNRGGITVKGVSSPGNGKARHTYVQPPLATWGDYCWHMGDDGRCGWPLEDHESRDVVQAPDHEVEHEPTPGAEALLLAAAEADTDEDMEAALLAATDDEED